MSTADLALGLGAIAFLALFLLQTVVLRPNGQPRRWFWHWVLTGRPHPEQW